MLKINSMQSISVRYRLLFSTKRLIWMTIV
nr:unnamed protein product [Callosobruchus analis]